MSGKHTPGPWVNGYGPGITGPSTPCIRDEDEKRGPFCADGLPYAVVSVPFTGMLKDSNEVLAVVPKVSGGDYQANARLIAGTPDLLAALESAPEPPVDYVDVQDILAHPATVREIFKTWRSWHEGIRAAALARIK